MTADSDSNNNRLEFSNVTIGILTALTEEYAACLAIFDPQGKGAEKHQRASSGELTCRLCAIRGRHGGEHVVAITLLPEMGNTAAAIAANILLQHCNSLHSLIMCGIAGAVPQPSKDEDHVRLGDIVVSNRHGVIQYDFGKQRDQRNDPGDPFAGFEFRGPPRPPGVGLLQAVRRMHAEEELLGRKQPREWEKKIDGYLSACPDVPRWKRPGPAKDKLIDSVDGRGDAIPHPRGSIRRSKMPRVFHGPVGAANIVLADPRKRNALRDKHAIKAIEMEGSGIADASWVANVGYLIVRGTCDYCNSTKSDVWRHYAALIAAAYACTVVEYLHADNGQASGRISSLSPLASALVLSAAIISNPASASDTILTKEYRQTDTGVNTQTDRPGQQMPASMELENSSVQTLPSSNRAVSLDITLSAPITESPDIRLIKELSDKLNPLVRESRSIGLEALAAELEKQLRVSPRKGSDIRDAWILLGRIESQRLFAAKQAGRPVDVSRLRELREEAKNVID